MPDHVFGYASLVALEENASPGRLRGYRRVWGVAMNNWEGGEAAKHFLDRDTGERPRVRVAYLDIQTSETAAVNGVAIPVDAGRLQKLDAREINYERIEVTEAFEGAVSGRVFTYVGLEAARERCALGRADGDVVVSRDYFAGVRLAFERLGAEALAEYERTTDPLPFPQRDLQVVIPASIDGFSPQ